MAEWSAAMQNDFPDSSFAWIAPGGKKDGEGKTTPRSLRHLVYRDGDGKLDAAHIRNSLARLNQVDGLSGAAADRVRAKLEAALRQVGGTPGKGGTVAIEYKTFGLTEPQFDDSGPGTFAGYTSLWDIQDSGGDIVLKGAYTQTLPQFIERGFVSWNHDWSNPVATIKAAHEDQKGLYIEADFHSDPGAQQARTRTQERVQRGKFMGLSIGYKIAPGGAERTKDARLLKTLDLFESGLVTVPMLAPAGVSSAKAYSPGPAGYDAEPPEGSYEELAEDLAEAYAAANGLEEARVLVVATFPGHAVLCVLPDYSGDTGPLGECEYWDVPYSGTDEPLTLGTPTAVDPQMTYVPSEDAKGLLLPLCALQAATKAGARHGKPTRERYAAMMTHATALVQHIGSLQAESAPSTDAGKAAVDGAALYGEFLAWQTRRLGVAV